MVESEGRSAVMMLDLDSLVVSKEDVVVADGRVLIVWGCSTPVEAEEVDEL